jgi:hypothetical protein
MKSILLALALSLPAHAVDNDTFCGIKEGQAITGVSGTRNGAVIRYPYTLGVMKGTRLVSTCQGKVHNISWHRLYYDGITKLDDGQDLFPLSLMADDVVALDRMLTAAGWTEFAAPNTDTDDPDLGWIWRYHNAEMDERTLIWQRMPLPDGTYFFRTSVNTLVDNPCTTGM